MEWKASIFYTSGDKNLNDGHANGFDGIVPNQQIAGGGFLGTPSLADRGLLNNAFAAGGSNFLNREPVPLTGTGLFLFGPNSVMPTMRAGLFEGQANFINPGILLFNAAFQAKTHTQIPRDCQYELGQIQSHRSSGGAALPKPHTTRDRPRHGCRHAISPIADRQHRSHRWCRRAGPRRGLREHLYRPASLFGIRQREAGVLMRRKGSSTQRRRERGGRRREHLRLAHWSSLRFSLRFSAFSASLR